MICKLQIPRRLGRNQSRILTFNNPCFIPTLHWINGQHQSTTLVLNVKYGSQRRVEPTAKKFQSLLIKFFGPVKSKTGALWFSYSCSHLLFNNSVYIFMKWWGYWLNELDLPKGTTVSSSVKYNVVGIRYRVYVGFLFRLGHSDLLS